MSKTEIIGLVVTLIGVGCFSIIFTLLYKSYIKSEISNILSGRSDIEIIDTKIYDNLSKVKKRRKIIDIFKTVLFYMLMIIIIPFFIFSLINKVQGNITMIGNRGVLVVASGSMSVKNPENEYLKTMNLNNQFDKFDMIVIEKVNSNADLKLYDVISYINDDGKNIIHRIVDMGINEDGKIEYVTRGDSNGMAGVDSYRPTLDDIKGKYVNKRIPLAGMFILFMQSPLGLVTILALAYCLIIIEKYNRKVTIEQDKRYEKLCSIIGLNDNIIDKEKIKTDFVERIYYKGFEYIFNEQGFIEKNEIKDEELSKKSNDNILKVLENSENDTKSILEISPNGIDGIGEKIDTDDSKDESNVDEREGS